MSDSANRERLLSLLTIVNKMYADEPMTATLIQKLLFLCQKKLPSCNVKYNYRVGHFGPFSKELAEDLAALKATGVIEIDNGLKVKVTKPETINHPASDELRDEIITQFPDTETIVLAALTTPDVHGKRVGRDIELTPRQHP